ncbi:hypothetical protein PILCRDRAFT_531402 [Piloderma croceum F 1598]|uniref:Uncharacterized protein n=1 Tax=Piloderma croceum (strain F 1598) TaxID=765440 RepID=A0A0C3FLJ6_PILCF|nr:hypothetical protein PILCRDRAFT_531402 [Piloderma croceum F 1598]
MDFRIPYPRIDNFIATHHHLHCRILISGIISHLLLCNCPLISALIQCKLGKTNFYSLMHSSKQ